jgi:DNA-binding MarR family transcriptional regulator
MTTDDPTELAELLRDQVREFVYATRRLDVAYPITSAQLSVLIALLAGPRRMTELAEGQGVRLPTMTTQVGRLERLGYLVRGRDAEDARVVTVTITDAGRAVQAEVRAARNADTGACLAQLGADDMAAVSAALPALRRLTDLLAARADDVSTH